VVRPEIDDGGSSIPPARISARGATAAARPVKPRARRKAATSQHLQSSPWMWWLAGSLTLVIGRRAATPCYLARGANSTGEYSFRVEYVFKLRHHAWLSRPPLVSWRRIDPAPRSAVA
jgi:hypothetical protein